MPKYSGENANLEEELDLPSNRESLLSKLKSFKLEPYLNSQKVPLVLILLGLVIVGLGVFLYKNTGVFEKDKIEIIQDNQSNQVTNNQSTASDLVVEIVGAVERPGVYRMQTGSRIDDLMTACGGLSAKADRDWVGKSINRAAKLADGQKIYIKSIDEREETANSKQSEVTSANDLVVYQTTSPVLGVENNGLTNINTASFTELDSLPGIGQVYGQKIIEQRPYSNIEELLTRKILPKNTFDKIKNLISVY